MNEAREKSEARLIFSGAAVRSRVARSLAWLLLGLALPTNVHSAAAQSTMGAAVRLQAGIEKEDVDGDLPSAMEIYQKIAADASAPRDVRARALLRLGGCDEKLGRQARQLYEQILHDYADQPAAVQARKRLALLKQQEHPAPPATMSLHEIEWSKLGSFSETDTDGDHAVFWASDNLYYGDLAGHSKRLILSTKHFGWIPSHDFNWVALNLLATQDRAHTLAIIKTDGTGYREIMHDDNTNSIFHENVSFHMSWSWDNRFLALADFSLRTSIAGQLWVVSVANGERRIVADMEGDRIRKAVFSPDGQYLAFVTYPRDMVSHQTSRVYIVPVRGGQPQLVYESTPWVVGSSFLCLMDWTADGRYLALNDVRYGKPGLYVLPVQSGKPAGGPEFVRFGEFHEGYTTRSGALVYSEIGSAPANSKTFITAIGADGRPQGWRRLTLDSDRKPSVSFSPDGGWVAYTDREADLNRRNLRLLNLSTGQERILFHSDYASLNCKYSSLHPIIFCMIEREKGLSELISVDADSGASEHIASFQGSRFIVLPVLDDRTFYFTESAWTLDVSAPPLVRWDRITQQETILVPGFNERGYVSPSMDARWVIRQVGGVVSVRPLDDGEWRILASNAERNMVPITTTDGEWGLYLARDSSGRPVLDRVPVSGGQSEHWAELPLDGLDPSMLTLSPDGKQLLFETSANRMYTLWALTNYVPPPK